MMQYFDPIQAFFLNTTIGGLIGPFALLVFGFFLMSTRKYRPLGGLWLILECIVIAQYITLANATPAYVWHIIILILGVILSIFQALNR